MASLYLKYNICYCIHYQKKEIGILCLENNNEVAIFIDPDYQNKGIGTKVLRDFLNMITVENSLETVVAEITLDNEKSIHLFQKLGFGETGEVRELPIGGNKVKVKKYILENKS